MHTEGKKISNQILRTYLKKPANGEDKKTQSKQKEGNNNLGGGGRNDTEKGKVNEIMSCFSVKVNNIDKTLA